MRCPPRDWRLLDVPPMTAAENMALDDALLELKGDGRTPNTIRFLQFQPRCVLVGYYQCVAEEIRVEYCCDHGIDINRRLTGGGAIFFDENQLGWEIICDKAFFGIRIPDLRLYRTLCLPVVSALELLGLKASFRPRNDIEIDGRKISGTGGTDSGDAFLFQGTMLVDFDVDTMLKALRIPVEKLKAKEIDSVKERVTCLRWELGRTPALEQIKHALRRGFERHLGIYLIPGGLTAEEEELFRAKLSHYHSEEWIDDIRPNGRTRGTLQGAFKSAAGLVRITLLPDAQCRHVQNVFITGDFLPYPRRALYDLEAEIRGAVLDHEVLRDIVRRFFEDGQIEIPGMTFEGFFRPLGEVLEKIDIAATGLPLEHCDHIHATSGSYSRILDQKPSVLLLPYCAKPTDCDLRNCKGCHMCHRADCTVGRAWQAGARRGMRVATVVSFEDLLAELSRMKEVGERAFVGCCCQPFFTKHAEDLEQAKVPGLLLDIHDTTCYDLDQAREAYAGAYERQTRLNLDLLDRVLSGVE